MTGGSSGIGLETALLLRQGGYDVIVADILPVPDGIEGLTHLKLDLMDPAAGAAVAELGVIDALVNNAGVGLWCPVELTPIEQLQRMFQLHVIAPLALIQAILPGMRSKGSGTIVNVSSIAAIGPFVLTGAYAASKAALLTLSEALANEVGHFGIKVRVVIPGSIVTNFPARRTQLGSADGPYMELGKMWESVAGNLFKNAGYEPVVTAKAIVDAIVDRSDTLLVPGSPDAAETMKQRRSLSESDWKARLWERASFKW